MPELCRQWLCRSWTHSMPRLCPRGLGGTYSSGMGLTPAPPSRSHRPHRCPHGHHSLRKKAAANTKGYFCNYLVRSSVQPAHLWLFRQGFKVTPRYRAQGQAQLTLQHDPTPWISWQPLQQAGGPPSQGRHRPCCVVSSTGTARDCPGAGGFQARIKTSSLTHAVNNKELAKPGELDHSVPPITHWWGFCNHFACWPQHCPLLSNSGHKTPDLESSAESAAQCCKLEHPRLPRGLLQTHSQHAHTRSCLPEGSRQETQTCRDTNSCSRLP